MRILLVEDDASTAAFIKQALNEAQYAVDIAPTLSEGGYLASINNYNLLILDCLLPDGDGRQLCRDLRARGINVPVLMLTGKPAVQDKVLALDSGADDYLTKPFDVRELLARVRALLRRQPNLQFGPRVVADLHLDPITRTVTRRNRPIELTPKEYQVLEMLLRHAGRVVTRTELIENIWDVHFDSGTNVVDVVIKNLRDKIDRKFSPKLIQTVRGVGYRIADSI